MADNRGSRRRADERDAGPVAGAASPGAGVDTDTAEAAAPDFFEEPPGVPVAEEGAGPAEAPEIAVATPPTPSGDERPAAEGAGSEPSIAEPAAGVEPPGEPGAASAASTGRTTCTVCGNATEALAFCGHCGASLAAQGGSGRVGAAQRLGRRVREAVMPSAGPLANGWQLATLVVLTGLAVGALLGNNVGAALIFGAALVPTLLATTMPRLDLFGRESPVLLLLAAVGGGVVGWLTGMAMGFAAERWWFDTGLLRFGAAGYGGPFAAAEGSAPVLVVLLNGVVLPLLALGLVMAIAYGLRRWRQLRNEAMDGMTLGAIGGAGWAIGAAVAFAWPVLRSPGPAMSVPDWTLLVVGLAVLRPIVLSGATAIVGTAVWQVLLSQRSGATTILALVGGGSVLLLSLGTVYLQPRDLELEVLWNVAVALLVMVALRLALRGALAFDRRSLAGENVPVASHAASPPASPAAAPLPARRHQGDEPIPNTRVVATGGEPLVTCPHCGKMTPEGKFCANCGRPLDARG